MEDLSGEIKIKLATLNDANRLNNFFNDYYNERRSLDQWKWLFAREISSDGNLLFSYAEYQNKIIGTQALIPIQFINSSNQKINTAKSEETLISHEFRGKNLFDLMYQKLFEINKVNNFDFIWGFTPAVKPFERIGFETLGTTSQVFKVFNNKGLSEITGTYENPRLFVEKFLSFSCSIYSNFKKPKLKKKDFISFERVNSFSYDLKSVGEKFLGRNDVTSINRNQDFFEWRIFNNPFNKPKFICLKEKGKPIAYVIYGINESVAAIVDFIVDPKYLENKESNCLLFHLLQHVENDVKKENASIIRSWNLGNNPLSKKILNLYKDFGWLETQRGLSFILKNQNKDNSLELNDLYITRLMNQGALF